MQLKQTSVVIGLRSITFLALIMQADNTFANDFMIRIRDSGNEINTKTLTTSGFSGGLVIPDGKVLNDGDLIFGINNYKPGNFSNFAKGTNYLFGLGILPNIELTGRLADYPINKDGLVGIRDLSVNFKFSLPKFFQNQPDIAIGKNDLAGGAVNFGSKYFVVSEEFGPMQFRAGIAKGNGLHGKFAGISLQLGKSGLAGAIDHNGGVTHAGFRYTSPKISSLNAIHFTASLQRSFGDKNVSFRKADSITASLNLIIPLGKSDKQVVSSMQYFEPVQANTAEEVAAVQASVNENRSKSMLLTNSLEIQNKTLPSPKNSSEIIKKTENNLDTQKDWVQQLKNELFVAGMERVRVGKVGNELIVEFENHRYNQNEVDALGLVFGLAHKNSPENIERISVAAKKNGLRISKTSVNRAAFHQFLTEGVPYLMKDSLTVEFGNGNEERLVWLDSEEGERGLSRIRIEPYLVKFVGTEFGVVDHALSANVQALVPLWKGAQLYSSYIGKVSESNNVADGVFSYARHHSGLKTAVVSQSYWLTDRIFNQLSVGKVLYDSYGFENETTWLLPKEGDYLSFQIANTWNNSGKKLRTDLTAGASYFWKYQPLDLGVELAYQRYVGNDRGPKIQINRWFGDMNAQLFLRKSNLETKIGFGISFPLTPRRGMRPGLIQLEGTSDFSTRLETKYARQGECNCITRGPVEERAPVFNADMEIFNRNRFGKPYISSNLYRLREIALQFSKSKTGN